MLAGNLEEFGLTDVFQLLTLTRKSGRLTIDAAGLKGLVEFRAGDVVYAVKDRRRMPLAARLLHRGLVRGDQLRRIVAAQSRGAGAISAALLGDLGLDRDAVAALLEEQIVDAVFGLLRLERGEFSFAPAAGDDAQTPVAVLLAADEVVAEATRRLAQLESLGDELPGLEGVLALVASPPQPAVTLTAEQWSLVVLLDGRRTVGEVVTLTGRGEFATGRVLAELLHAGVVERVATGSAGRGGIDVLVQRRDLLARLEHTELGAPPQHSSAIAALFADEMADDGPDDAPSNAAESARPAVEPLASQGDGGDEGAPESPDADVDRAQVARELASLGLGDAGDGRGHGDPQHYRDPVKG